MKIIIEKIINILQREIDYNAKQECILKDACQGCEYYHSCIYPKKRIFELEEIKSSLSVVEIMGKWQLCVLCEGKGRVESDSSSSFYKTCYICKGKGLIKRPENE